MRLQRRPTAPLAALALAALAAAGCSSSEPAPPLTCTEPKADCDGNAANGCETDTTSAHDHCGRCGRSCLDGACSAGQCSQLFVTVENKAVGGIALDATSVYFTTDQGSVVRRVKKDGTGATTLVTAAAGTGDPGLRSVAVEGAKVWWVTPGVGLRSVDAAGGAATLVDAAATAVVTFAGGVFYTRSDGSILGAPLAGGTTSTLATAQKDPVDLAVDSTGTLGLFWANHGTAAASYADGAIRRVVEGVITDWSPSEPKPSVVGVGGSNVVWSLDDGPLRWKRADTVGVPKVLSAATYGVAGIAVLDQRLYYLAAQTAFPVSARGGPLWTMDLSKEVPVAERMGGYLGTAMAIDDKYVYAAGAVAVWKVAR